MLHRINADAIGAVVFYHARDPRIKELDDRVVLGVDVSKGYARVAEPALLDVRLVVVVGDPAEWMEVGLRVERRKEGVVRRQRICGHVVYDNVEHEVHAAVVEGSAESLEVGFCSEMAVK